MNVSELLRDGWVMQVSHKAQFHISLLSITSDVGYKMFLTVFSLLFSVAGWHGSLVLVLFMAQ